MTFGIKRIELDQKTLSEIKRLGAELSKANEVEESCIYELHKLQHPFPTPEDIEEIKQDVQELAEEYFRASDVYYVDNLEPSDVFSTLDFYIVNRAPFKNEFLFARLSVFIEELCLACWPIQFCVHVLPEDYQNKKQYAYLLKGMQGAVRL